MSQELSFTVTVDGTDHEITAEVDDLFSRDLSQALLLGWHINWPDSVWEPHNEDWFDSAPGPDEDFRQTYALQKLKEWEITSPEDLPLSQKRELRLVVLLLRARMDSNMTDPAGRAGKILRYAPNDVIEEIVETMDFARADHEGQVAFIRRGLRTELVERNDQGEMETIATGNRGWNGGRRPEDPNQDPVLTNFWNEVDSA
ncbi:hypothetical protein BSZ35_04475 [Salinibacter sp. 10B]|uniref:hypothetical protein n=1 Tax=Salinibacter sp. 10B TaxID=1923971 RepID=UPI000CF46B2C|nr:hypothetical protein [Salinibacter sp. 10B]PQJ33964.1 hypothetical protein BSZ35_04475 [Salinibacter sp. 10B]